MNPVFKGTEYQFLKEGKGVTRKIDSTEAKYFKEKVVKCVIFASFLPLILRCQVTTELKSLRISNMLVIGYFREFSFSGRL